MIGKCVLCLKKCAVNNLVVRALSGAVFVVVVVGSILLHRYAYAAVMLVFTAWAIREYYDVVMHDGVRVGKCVGMLIGVALFAVSFFYAQGSISGDWFLVFIPLLVAVFIVGLYSGGDHSFRAIAYTVVGVAYVALPFSLCNGLVFFSGVYQPDVLIGFFILLWTNDTFAYLTGSAFGRRRLFERISPNKSWEGFLGGLACTMVLSLAVARLCPVMPVRHWVVVAGIVVVFGVYGDLLESLLKRNFGIKDSGRFLPGHGGILDRFDAVLLAAPMVFFYLRLIVF